MALAFSAARWLTTKKPRRMFFEGLKNLPSEVVLYWFTLCFYGYQQAAGRAALRTLLTHEEPDQPAISRDAPRKPKKRPAGHESIVLLFLTEKPGCRRLVKPLENSAPG